MRKNNYSLYVIIFLLFFQYSADSIADTQLKLKGLKSQIQIVRDENGIPHIYAHNDYDAYYAMGYIEASDRFFQMDCARRYYEGKSAELFGEKALATDRQMRQTGLPYYAMQSLKALSPETRQLLQAYSEGVNKYIENNVLPTAYKTLHLTKKSIPNWRAADSLTIARGINANVSSLSLVAGITRKPVLNLDDIARTDSFLKYIKAGEKKGFDGKALWFQDIYRSAPNGVAVTIPDFFKKQILSKDKADNVHSTINPAYIPHDNNLSQLNDDGSNIFVIDGKHTSEGYPILANDSHYPLHTPPLWYLINVTVDDPMKPLDAHLSVLIPGSFIYKSGNNHHIAWGSTTSRVDVSDVYIEHLQLNKEGIPSQVLFKEKYLPLKQIKQVYYYNTFAGDTLKIADPHSIQDDTFLIPYLNDGPLLRISGNIGYGVQSTIFGKVNAHDVEGYFSLLRSKNLSDFKNAIRSLELSYYNFGYVDDRGNIAFYESGAIPLRRDLESGKVINAAPFFVRNSDLGDKNTWIFLKNIPKLQSIPYQIIPFDEMPHVINPRQGFFVNSNNAPVNLTLNNNPLSNHLRSNSGIYFIDFQFSTGERASQITDLIKDKISHQHKITLDDVKKIQTNNQSFLAKHFVPYILTALDDARSMNAPQELQRYTKNSGVIEAVNRLKKWDYTTPTGIEKGYDAGENSVSNSIAATLFYVWQGRFFVNTIEKTLLDNDLPKENYQVYTSAILNLLDTFKAHHGIGASGLNFFKVSGIRNADSARDFLILKSLQEALDLLKSHYFASAFSMSPNQNDYLWGKLHRVIFTNPLDNNIPPFGGFNNLTPELPGISRDGGIETINASNFNGLARSPADFVFSSGASLRHIIEMNPNHIISFISLPGGENEEVDNPYFANILGDWLSGQYRKDKESSPRF